MNQRFPPRDFEASANDDYSGAFSRIRARLVDSRGVHLADFARDLRPNYGRVYFDIALGFFALAIVLGGVALLQRRGVSVFLLTPLAAIWTGYWVAYLHLFLHEGAHWNLAPERKLSDWLCNLSVGWLVLMDVREYRKVHFQHHRALGTVTDSEISYFFPVNLIFVAKGTLGIRLAERWLSYQRWQVKADANRAKTAHRQRADRPSGGRLVPLAGAAMHAIIIAGLLWAGASAAAAAWIIAMGCVFPLLATLRQALEHRNENASSAIDYTRTDHGAYTRLFGTGWLASTFGGAGFNRHLLHHWEPQVSYTRLADLERFLADTPMAAIMNRRRTSYHEAFRRLFSIY
jgi:fatty acid desaturase